MNKAISVWLIVDDGQNKGKVVLQKRSLKNETFPFVCQAAFAGKIESNEDEKKAIVRECKEELGNNFCENFDFSKLEFIGRGKFVMKKENWESYNYLSKISASLLKLAKIHDEAFGEFVFASREDEIYSIESKKDPKNNIVLFDDQYKILKKILDGIKRNYK